MEIITCDECNGSGYDSDGESDCPVCGGCGVVTSHGEQLDDDDAEIVRENCRGDSWMAEEMLKPWPEQDDDTDY